MENYRHTKIGRSDHCHHREWLVWQMIPESFGMNCPAWFGIFMKRYAVTLPRPKHFSPESPSDASVCIWNGTGHAFGTKKSICLKQNDYTQSSQKKSIS